MTKREKKRQKENRGKVNRRERGRVAAAGVFN
jgi:hypothetical protein